MKNSIKSIRPFIGAKNFNISRSFYAYFGFKETVIANNLSVFKMGEFAFYLQDAYVKDWVDNTMIFMEVKDVNDFWNEVVSLNLTKIYTDSKIVPIKNFDWGKEFYVHDPSGILWHIGEFFN